MPISPEADVWNFILENCTEAISALRPFYDKYYPSKEAAYILYAKVNLWLAALADRDGTYLGKAGDDYRATAEEYADKVLSNSSFSMTSTSEDFAGLYINGTQNSEIVFALANARSKPSLIAC